MAFEQQVPNWEELATRMLAQLEQRAADYERAVKLAEELQAENVGLRRAASDNAALVSANRHLREELDEVSGLYRQAVEQYALLREEHARERALMIPRLEQLAAAWWDDTQDRAYGLEDAIDLLNGVELQTWPPRWPGFREPTGG